MTAAQLFPADTAPAPAGSKGVTEALSASEATERGELFVAALEQALDGKGDGTAGANPARKLVPPATAADLGPAVEGTLLDENVNEGTSRQRQTRPPTISSAEVPEDLPLDSETPRQETEPHPSISDPALVSQACFFTPTLATPSLPSPEPDTEVLPPSPAPSASSPIVASPRKPAPIAATPPQPTLNLSPPTVPLPRLPALTPPETNRAAPPSDPTLPSSALLAPTAPSWSQAPRSSVAVDQNEKAVDGTFLESKNELPSVNTAVRPAPVDAWPAALPIPAGVVQRLPGEERFTAKQVTALPAPEGSAPGVVPAEVGMAMRMTTGRELPGSSLVTEEVAATAEPLLSVEEAAKAPATAIKPLFKLGLAHSAPSVLGAFAPGGTAAAKSLIGMESFSNSESQGAGATAGRKDADELLSAAVDLAPDQGESTHSQNLAAMDWQSGGPVASVDRSAPEIVGPGQARAMSTVDRIASLVLREAALIKPHTTDSLSLLVRPDAHTELVLHLVQRDGQVEAFVRCERGDFGQLSALWPQLQESLAGQKIRLAPLQESSLYASPAQDPAGGLDFSPGGQPSYRQSPSGEEYLADRPGAAPQGSPADVATSWRGNSGARLDPSRPGWETWA